MNHRHPRLILRLLSLILLGAVPIRAATFPGNARLETSAPDSTSSLTWNGSALTVACWFKITVPSDFTLAEDMAILVNNRTSNASNHAFAICLSATTGNIEFTARGSGGIDPPIKVIERPMIERWYHLAVVRSGSSLTVYVDGRQMLVTTTVSGNANTTDGISVGGWGNAKYFRGEIQEIAIYQRALNRAENFANMLKDVAPTFTGLRGYYKLPFAILPADNLNNYANAPSAGTEALAKQGSGTVDFPETDKQGEQSAFDSRKNNGLDASSAFVGGFSWDNDAIGRPTPGVPFGFGFNYSSSIGFNGQALEGGLDLYSEDSVMGRGWRHSFQTRLIAGSLYLTQGNSYVGLLTESGSIETWRRNIATATYTTTHGEYRGEMSDVESGAYVEWTTPERLIYKFYHPTNWPDSFVAGKLLHIRDLNGNTETLSYEEGTGRLTAVSDTAGGLWAFGYDGAGLLTSVSGPSKDAATKWTVGFTYMTVTVAGSPVTVLATKTLAGPVAYAVPPSTTWSFLYTTSEPAGLLYRISNPRSNREIEIAYDKYGRKTTEWDGMGRLTTFKYNVPALRQMTTTRQAGGLPDAANDRMVIDTFDRKLRILAHKDALTNLTSFEYDEAGNVTAATDAKGNRTTMTYDSRSNVLSSTDALGRTTRQEYGHVLAGGIPHNEPTLEIRPATEEAPLGWENRFTYDAAGNLVTHADAIGILAKHGYDNRGLVIASTDGNGNETRFGYDSNGFQNSRTIAFGTPQAATWNSIRSELGWPITETNPLAETTSIGYNLYGQVTRTEDGIGRIFTRQYDANGNLIEESDGNGGLTRHDFNAADERIKLTDRLNNVWDFGYNNFGELTTSTSPAALSDGTIQRNTVTNAYNAGGQLVKVTDPNGDLTTFEYDVNGNQTATIDKLGKRWEKTYDALDRVVAERDPEGNVKSVSFDAAGRVKVVTTPNGNPSSHTYDGRSRLREWMDAEGYRWIYTYDGVGNILDIEDALHGHYVMTYGPRNERLSELNQDKKSWTYSYDSLIRLKTQLDPNGVQRTLSYDSVGRLEQVEFNTGRINTMGYDNNNNVVSVIRSKPGTPSTALYLDYDALDRLTETRDAFSKTVRYGYDSLGRVTTKTYPGGKVLAQTYDRLGRLKGLSFAYAASQIHSCSFTYDKAGRMTGRTYPNGITQNNGFDDSGRLTTLDYKASGGSSLMALSYAYDRNGNKAGGSEQGTLDWQAAATPDYDERSRFTDAGKLIDRTDVDTEIPKVMNYTYDDSGNMKQAAAPGETYTLDYDEDNRTTSIRWENGLASKDIVNRYDALGRRISRNADGIETRYVLDLAGGMERILCDTDSSGNIQAWYVHGPDLCFKVSKTGALTCYHADAMGNIVRTTDTTGATVNQYAYTPYGRSLDTADSAPSSDPYRFVGSQGVMLELPGLYFMRARYYSADAGMFLATDPVKNIGPGWKPEVFGYSKQNPMSFADPLGLYGIKTGISFSASGGLFLSGDWSAGFGLAFETDALRKGDFRNGIGFYIDTGVQAEIGMNLSGGPGIGFTVSGEQSEYGVDSMNSNGSFGGKANYEGGIARFSIGNDGGWSLGLGPKADVGISVSGGKSATSVFHLGGGASSQSSGNSANSTPFANSAPQAGAYAVQVNNAQIEKPKPPSKAHYDQLTKLINKWDDKMDSIDAKIDKLRAKIKDYKKKKKSTSKLNDQLKDLKDDWRDAKDKRDKYRDERKKLK